MSRPTPAQVRAALQPSPEDGRLPRLGKLAALALIDAGRVVARSTLVAKSKEVDDEPGRKKPGFSEASLRTNKALRAVYLLARTAPARGRLKRRGRIGAHIARMTKAEIATALVVGRMAAVEREEEHRLALERLGGSFDAHAVAATLEVRRELPANRILDVHESNRTRLATLRAKTAIRNAAAVQRAKEWAARRGIRATAEWLADRCGLHPGTVERLAMAAATAASNARTFDFEVALAPALTRLAKWDLARALEVERSYIRALHAATMAIGLLVIDREHLQRRAEVRAAQDERAAPAARVA